MGMNQRENAFRERSHGSQVLSYREKKEEPMLAESNLSFESRREFQASYQFHFIINPVFKSLPRPNLPVSFPHEGEEEQNCQG
jgi:hypothetical protein